MKATRSTAVAPPLPPDGVPNHRRLLLIISFGRRTSTHLYSDPGLSLAQKTQHNEVLNKIYQQKLLAVKYCRIFCYLTYLLNFQPFTSDNET